MARRLIQTERRAVHQLAHPLLVALVARVYRDAEWNEYRVTLAHETVGGALVALPDATYHTDDKGDALNTAQVMMDDHARLLLASREAQQ